MCIRDRTSTDWSSNWTSVFILVPWMWIVLFRWDRCGQQNREVKSHVWNDKKNTEWKGLKWYPFEILLSDGCAVRLLRQWYLDTECRDPKYTGLSFTRILRTDSDTIQYMLQCTHSKCSELQDMNSLVYDTVQCRCSAEHGTSFRIIGSSVATVWQLCLLYTSFYLQP